MKFREPLDDILGQRVKIKILRCLALNGMELSGRKIAEETGISPAGAHKALKDLVESHIILERRAGRAFLFKLNQENYLAQEMLMPLFEREDSLLKLALGSMIKKIHASIISLILYGSLAQKRETPRSDIDLLVIVSPKNKRKIEEAFDKISSGFLTKYGRALSPYIITIKEFQNKYRERLPFIVDVVKTGIVIRGKLISELLSYDR
jgi:predicted nucleotidyltransferase